MSGKWTGLLLAAIVLLTGCASVPPEAVQLNASVTQALQDLRTKHENLVNAYFGTRVESFDRFFLQTYLPEYEQAQRNAWPQVYGIAFDPDNPAHRAELTGNTIAEYEDLVGQIRALERQFLQELDAAYTSLIRANETVTALLVSGNRLGQSESAIVATAAGFVPGLDTAEIDRRIDEIANRLGGGQ